MYEDALCNNPCGQEPLGCANCPEIGRAEPSLEFYNQDDYYDYIAYTDDYEDEIEED